MKLKISVTEDCIMNGEKGHGDKCAVALAVRDIFPQAFVDQSGIYPYGLTYEYNSSIGILQILSISTPEEVKQFIEWFDEKTSYRGLMQPFEFEIDIPEEIISKINIDELRPLLTNHKNLKLVNQ